MIRTERIRTGKTSSADSGRFTCYFLHLGMRKYIANSLVLKQKKNERINDKTAREERNFEFLILD